MTTANSAGAGAGHQPAACLYNADEHELGEHLEQGRFFWLDLENPDDQKLRRLAHKIRLHPLTVEDARSFEQRPKFDDYEGYVFLVVYGVDPEASAGEPLLREVHLIISGDFVVTIHRHPLPALHDLRERYPKQPSRSEQFLVYKILDAVTSTFLPVLTRIDDEIDQIEQDVVEVPTQAILQRIFSLKRDLVAMRRVVSPERDLFARDGDRIAELPGLEAGDRLYFRDVYDSLVRVAELVDSYRDLLSGATDLYLSTIANRQGEVNKQLTMIATVFLPLTFLTGFFGQNFAYLTDHILNSALSFAVLGIGLLLASTVGFIVFFRRKGWM